MNILENKTQEVQLFDNMATEIGKELQAKVDRAMDEKTLRIKDVKCKKCGKIYTILKDTEDDKTPKKENASLKCECGRILKIKWRIERR